MRWLTPCTRRRQGLARHTRETPNAQNVVHLRTFREPLGQRLWLGEPRNVDDEGLEILVVVLAFGVVMRGPRSETVLRRRTKAEQHGRIDAPALSLDFTFTARGMVA